MIVVNYTCAFPAVTSQHVCCNKSPVLHIMSCFFCLSPLDEQTGVFSVQNAWIERRWSDCFDVQFAVILLLSDFSSHTHVPNAQVNCYKPVGSQVLAAICGSVLMQVYFRSPLLWNRKATKCIFVHCFYYVHLLFLQAATKEKTFSSIKLCFSTSASGFCFVQFISKPTGCEEVVTHDATTFTHTQIP